MDMEIIDPQDGSFVDFCTDISTVTVPTTEFVPQSNSTPMKPMESLDVNNNNVTNRSLTCEICDRKFTRRDNLRRHFKTHQDGASCAVCSRHFNSESELDAHKLMHQRILCNLCGNTFSKKSHLNEHLQNVHGQKKYKCIVSGCDKSFNRQQFLNSHVNMHMGTKQYNCARCMRGFYHIYSCMKHEKTCGKVQNSVCPNCCKVFSSKDALRAHIKSVHEKRVFACHCGKLFQWRSGLSRHQSKCQTKTNTSL